MFKVPIPARAQPARILECAARTACAHPRRGGEVLL
jgi:hypothetical protein